MYKVDLKYLDCYFGPFCPNCGGRSGTQMSNICQCSKCNWNGEFKDLLNSYEEFKNIKRTELIDKMLK